MMKKQIKRIMEKAGEIISLKMTLAYFSLMAVLYLFSLFGSMFGSTDFTYADF